MDEHAKRIAGTRTGWYGAHQLAPRKNLEFAGGAALSEADTALQHACEPCCSGPRTCCLARGLDPVYGTATMRMNASSTVAAAFLPCAAGLNILSSRGRAPYIVAPPRSIYSA